MKLIRDIFTGKDNKTYDIGRILIFMGTNVFFFLSILETFHGHDFNPIQFGTGMGLLLTGGAGSLAIKQKTEPDGENK